MALRDGRAGLVATATDVTALKRQEQHLKVVMRELNHRSKNLLTIVLSIARQSARGFDLPREFMSRLQDRLMSLASAHDALANRDWRGAELRDVIEGQLKHQLQTYGPRIRIDGAECMLPPEAAHYVGMALHELGSNAVKYGCAGRRQGRRIDCLAGYAIRRRDGAHAESRMARNRRRSDPDAHPVRVWRHHPENARPASDRRRGGADLRHGRAVLAASGALPQADPGVFPPDAD
jgi:two-component sensor histidine kinase